jgi:hypothetical protein
MGLLVQMRHDFGTFLVWALRAQAGGGPHAELARRVVLAVLVAQLLAASGHERPPHAARRPPRQSRPRRRRVAYRESLSGRRPRG